MLLLLRYTIHLEDIVSYYRLLNVTFVLCSGVGLADRYVTNPHGIPFTQGKKKDSSGMYKLYPKHTMEAFQSAGLSPRASQANPVDLRSMLTSAIFSSCRPDRTALKSWIYPPVRIHRNPLICSTIYTTNANVGAFCHVKRRVCYLYPRHRLVSDFLLLA